MNFGLHSINNGKCIQVNNVIQIMEWLRQSPDDNPIEKVWNEVNRFEKIDGVSNRYKYEAF